MPGAIGQIGQNVADNLFEIGQSAVKGTVKAATDVAGETIEQIVGTSQKPASTAQASAEGPKAPQDMAREARKQAEKTRYEEVKAELEEYRQRAKVLEQKIADEKAAETQHAEQQDQEKKVKNDSWIKKIINRATTSTEKGRLQE